MLTIIGMLQGTPKFELVKLNIISLLTSRDRTDLIPGWETFLSTFPTAEVDDKVPCEDIYGQLLDLHENPTR